MCNGIYSLHSRQKVVHLPGCAYVDRIRKANRKQFRSFALALDNGYRLCRCCCPSAQRKYDLEKRRIEAFCRENGLIVFPAEDAIRVISKLDTWRIVRTYGKDCFDLYHKNTQTRLREPESAIPGYHLQKVYRETILGYLQVIRTHDDYRALHPLNAPKAAPPEIKPLKGLQKDGNYQKIKGTNRYRKQQRALKKQKRREDLRRVYDLIDTFASSRSAVCAVC